MRILKDELLGLADDPMGDVLFKNQCLNMDVLYRTGETPQVRLSDLYNDCNLVAYMPEYLLLCGKEM